MIPAVFGLNRNRRPASVAVNLADETVDIDHQAFITRAGAHPPRTSQCLCQHAVELADMAEGERSQERSQRRWCRQPATQKPARATRSQYLTVMKKPCSGGRLRGTTGRNAAINAVAVGTLVARRPPRRSQRAGTTALGSCLG